MKKNLKVLISSLMIALIFASPQAIHGMEDSSKESQQEKRRGEEIRENPFDRCPIEIRFNILQHAAIYNYLRNRHNAPLKLVCKDWHDIIDKDFVNRAIISAYKLSGEDEEIYRRFLKGVLIYRPQEGSDVGRIDLPIAALGNPLEGTFDLSQCGDVGNYLSISTGYRKGRRAENANKVEIWLAPRFLIEKELNNTAGHFKDIFPNWHDSNPIGIFWTWGGWNDLGWYDYLVTENFDKLSNNNLYEKWQHNGQADGYNMIKGAARATPTRIHQKISCSFCELSATD